MTIGKLLTDALNARLLDNHTLLNPSEALFSRSDPQHRDLRLNIRKLVFDALAKARPPIRVVFTDALGDDRGDQEIFDDYRRLAEQRRIPLHCVLLTCHPEENRRRLVAEGRSDHRKLTDISVLDGLREKHRLLRSDGCIELDVTTLTAQDACEKLQAELSL